MDAPLERRPAVCLVSGGMDSAVVLAEAVRAGFAPVAISFDYGQRHAVELDAAARVAAVLGASEHRVVAVDLRAVGGSALTDAIDVPKDRAHDEIGRGVPSTYVPARNTVFLAIALGLAETVGATDLFIGANAVDYSGYPDCRPTFLAAFEALANAATAAGADGGAHFRVHAPLLELSKADIVRRGLELGVDFALTHTCYDPRLATDGAVLACGRCDACLLRLAGFAAAGESDPVRYAEDGDGSIPADTFGRAKLAGAVSELARVLAVAQRLRAPGGCPWDREQSVRSLAPALVEEAFEAVDGLDELARTGDARGAVEELGDLLFSIALLCQVASEEGVFDLERAARGAAEKIVRRHPHVYGEAKDLSSDAALAQWERIKAEERAARGRDDTSALSGVPRALPALQRAARLGAKAMALGFRWESADGALAKVREEVLELDEAYRGDDRGALERELGDVLLATSQFANYVGVDPETAARDAAHRFETRFRAMEQELGDGAGHADLERWMDAWRRAKARTT